MALVKDEVIVIKGINYSEADKILTVFSRNRGKFSIIAKGVRKIESKNRSAIQTLSRTTITYYEGRNLDTLVEASQIHVPDVSKDQITHVSKVLKGVNKLVVEDDEDPEIYEKLSELFDQEYNLREVNKFRIWLLEHLGFLSNMRVCSVCNNSKENVGIDLNEMKVICQDCLSKQKVNGRYSALKDVKYESSAFDKAIDDYVDKIIMNNDVSNY